MEHYTGTLSTDQAGTGLYHRVWWKNNQDFMKLSY